MAVYRLRDGISQGRHHGDDALCYLGDNRVKPNLSPDCLVFDQEKPVKCRTAQEYETLTVTLTAELFRLGVGTAVFEPTELASSEKYKLRCRRQADGSVAIILEEPAS